MKKYLIFLLLFSILLTWCTSNWEKKCINDFLERYWYDWLEQVNYVYRDWVCTVAVSRQINKWNVLRENVVYTNNNRSFSCDVIKWDFTFSCDGEYAERYSTMKNMWDVKSYIPWR